MPYEISIENEGAKITTRYYGELTTAEIYAAYDERFTDSAKIKKYELIINDYTEVSGVMLDGLDVSRLAKTYLDAAIYKSKVLVVSIMPTDLQYGLGRMWQGYAYEIPWEETIVRTRQEAFDWLAEKTG